MDNASTLNANPEGYAPFKVDHSSRSNFDCKRSLMLQINHASAQHIIKLHMYMHLRCVSVLQQAIMRDLACR